MSEQNYNEISDVIQQDDIDMTNSEAPGEEDQNNKPSRNKRLLSVIDYVEIVALGICLVIALFSFAFRICTVDGDSMKNTLLNGEKLVISDLFYTPERGDVIVFHQTGNRNLPLVKRVIGVEGDTVVIDFNTWTVKITDKNGDTITLDEEYINIDTPIHHLSGTHTYVVPEGCVFVLGDNRNDSMDSTDSYNVGYVDNRRILGKVIFRYSPINKIGIIQ